MSSMTMPAVSQCTVAECAYNQDGCHAFAITVGAGAACGTFIPLDVKGGVPARTAQVGACTRADCVHNADLECTAPAIEVGAEAACLTFAQA